MDDQGDQPIHDVEQRLNSRCTWFTAHITTLVHVLTDASAWDDIFASLAILVKRTPSQQIAKAKNAPSTSLRFFHHLEKRYHVVHCASRQAWLDFSCTQDLIGAVHECAIDRSGIGDSVLRSVRWAAGRSGFYSLDQA